MSAEHRVEVALLPHWMPIGPLLGPGPWDLTRSGETVSACCTLGRREAAQLTAQLRGLGFGGHALEVTVSPKLPRSIVRAARTEDARARRATTPGFSRGGTRLDAVGRMSLTPEDLALQMAQRCAGKLVIDAGCGAGGNAIAFARQGARVVAIERDPSRLDLARHNARIYGVLDRIRFRCADVCDLLPSLSADVVFVDPPWGADWSRACCTLADLPLLHAVLKGVRAHGTAPTLWAKVPPSFRASDLPDANPTPLFGRAPGDRHRVKFLWLRLPLIADVSPTR